MLDLGRPTPLGEAIQVARLIEGSGANIFWWEEPLCSTDDLKNLAELRQRSDLAIAAGERGAPGHVYNIGGGSRVSINTVLALIGQVTGRPVAVVTESTQKGDMRDTYADTSRARTDLGFVPEFSLEQGLAAEHRWLLERTPM